MEDIRFLSLIDGHAHVLSVAEAMGFPKLMDAINAVQVGLACQSDLCVPNNNPAGLVLKARYPERFYFLAGLDHSAHLYGLKETASLSYQARWLSEIGADGIKILASKPTERKRLGVPLDGFYFSGFFKTCETLRIPLLWHVADPEEFWDPKKLPQWAREKNWGYDSSFLPKESLYAEAENVLRTYPGLRVIFPHLYFLSADLDRAEKFLTEFPNANFDLAPGVELYYNLSRTKEKAQEFFCRFSDRILFGTDIGSGLSIKEARARAGIIYRFLSGSETFRVPEEVDFLLGSPEDGIIHGLALPEEVLNAILQDNFHRIFGKSPRRLNIEFAIEECQRIAGVETEIKSCPIEKTEGMQAATQIEKN